jgi:hypothetical protein
MSTRALIRVITNEEDRFFYHHRDGYIDFVGKELCDIAEKQAKYGDRATEFFIQELPRRYEDRPDIEELDGLPIDISYVYTVDLISGLKEVSVVYGEYNEVSNERKTLGYTLLTIKNGEAIRTGLTTA